MSEHQKRLYERLDALHVEVGAYGEEFQDLVQELLSAHRRGDETTWQTVQSWVRRRKPKAAGAAALKNIT